VDKEMATKASPDPRVGLERRSWLKGASAPEKMAAETLGSTVVLILKISAYLEAFPAEELRCSVTKK
jgi:hypothetical protein